MSVALLHHVLDVRPILDRAEAALASDELADARDAFEQVLRADPTNLFARRGIHEVTRELIGRAQRAGLQRNSRVRLVYDLGELLRESHDDAEADVLAVLARKETVSLPELTTATGLSESAMIEAVISLIERGVVSP